jgi:hypothetical protein
VKTDEVLGVQVPASIGVANYVVPESCALRHEAYRKSLTGVLTGQPLSCERSLNPSADVFLFCGRQHAAARYGGYCRDLAWSKTLAC